jgi:hypothetical protein
MQTVINVIKPATELSLITLFEAKNALSMTDEKSDDLIKFIVVRASDEIARYCNRVLAQETVEETFYDMEGHTKLFLERYPVKEITSVTSGGAVFTPTNYQLDKLSGKLLAVGGGFWSAPTVVTYTGGYELPFESPPALRQASILAVREAYYASIRGDSTIRMVGHKESRVIYFDPNAALKASTGSGSSGGGSAATRSMKALLERFTRMEV